MNDATVQDALAHLRQADPVLARVISRIGPYRPRPRRRASHFHDLARMIVFQQLSGKAAGTIHGRFCALFPRGHAEPELLLQMTDDTLRAAGLSRQKIGYLRDLADKVHGGALPLDRVRYMTDDAIIEHLVQVKGIGRWTAQMFLMFRLGRPDVLPELDLGIQNAIRLHYGKRRRVTPRDVLRIGRPWRPYASIACWYLWRSLDGDGPN
ncbi:MAG TPA: DNA-3-methyladenine glycosylase 2 family protein [Gemmatimonadaceae bacterium]|nr:DNA-3-methyladenine glycosylase 2 family protein [Gemmatimonadaceae bacterium]